jgi:hypothetical protein
MVTCELGVGRRDDNNMAQGLLSRKGDRNFCILIVVLVNSWLYYHCTLRFLWISFTMASFIAYKFYFDKLTSKKTVAFPLKQLDQKNDMLYNSIYRWSLTYNCLT